MKLDVDIHLTVGKQGRAFALHARFESSQDRLVLFGPSGVGKTLTIQAIAGLLAPDQGHIRLGERVLLDTARGIDLPARQRRIGYVFQDYALFPHLSVARNIAFGLMPTLPWPTWQMNAAIRRRVDDMMQALDITGLQDRLPATLSGGQRQRVALARALIRQPELLLLDEPFSAVDAFTRMKLQDLLTNVVQQHGLTVLLVTHDLDEAVFLSDKVVVLDQVPGPACGTMDIHLARPRLREDDALARTRTHLLRVLQQAHAL